MGVHGVIAAPMASILPDRAPSWTVTLTQTDNGYHLVVASHGKPLKQTTRIATDLEDVAAQMLAAIATLRMEK
jgi:hypothetical protein